MKELKVGDEVFCPGQGILMVAGRVLKQGQWMVVLSPWPAPMPVPTDPHGIKNLVMAPEEVLRKVE